MRVFLLTLALLAGAGPVWAQAGEFGTGPVQLQRLGRVDIREPSEEAQAREAKAGYVRIDGRLRFAFDDGDWHKIVDAFPSRAAPKIYLIGYSIGNSCAAIYAIVDLTRRRPVFVDPIGDCNVSYYLWTGRQVLFRNVFGSMWSYSTANGLESFPARDRARHVAEGLAAYRRGDFDAAARRLWALDDRQWPEVPEALRRMSRIGKGMPKNPWWEASYAELARAAAGWSALPPLHPSMWLDTDPFERQRGRTLLEIDVIDAALRAAFGPDGRAELDTMDDQFEPVAEKDGVYFLSGCQPRFCDNGKYRLAIAMGPTVRVAGCVLNGWAPPRKIEYEGATGRAPRLRRDPGPAVDMPLCDADDETFERLAREIVAR